MDITKTYGIKVFSDAVMSQRLPRDVYESLKLTQRMGYRTRQYNRRSCGCCHARLGCGKRRHPLFSLVPAYDQYHRWKT